MRRTTLGIEPLRCRKTECDPNTTSERMERKWDAVPEIAQAIVSSATRADAVPRRAVVEIASLRTQRGTRGLSRPPDPEAHGLNLGFLAGGVDRTQAKDVKPGGETAIHRR